MKIGFRNTHPISAFVFYLFAFTLSLTAKHPITVFSVFASALLFDIKLRGKKAVSFALKFLLPLTLFTTLINGLFSHYGVTVLFTLPDGNLFTLEAVVYGFVFALRADCVLIWLNTFNEILTSDKIIYLFGRISPRTALIISMVLRFIPLTARQAEEITRSEKGIGGECTSTSFISKIRSAASRLSVLVSWSLERGIDTQYSMLARGYGLKHRTSYGNYIFGIKDITVILLTAVGFLGYILTIDTLTAVYNPTIIIPIPEIKETAVSIILAVSLLFPTLNDIAEEKKWSTLA